MGFTNTEETKSFKFDTGLCIFIISSLIILGGYAFNINSNGRRISKLEEKSDKNCDDHYIIMQSLTRIESNSCHLKEVLDEIRRRNENNK